MGLRLSTSLRSVGWSNEPNVFRPRAVPGTLRTSFIAKKVASMLRWAVAVDAATMYVMQCPAFMKEGVSFALRPWYWKPVDMLFWVTMVEGNAVLVHGAVTLISVALHLSRPEDWTHSFGYWSDAYTIRRFWGRVWHQYLRGFVSAHGKFLARRVLNLQPGTNFSSYVQLYVAFVLSGIMHWVAEYTAGMEWTKSTSVAFFVMQATGIAFEDGVIAAARKLAVGKPRCIHVLGYSWVLAWFYLTLPTWWDPIHRLGLLDMFDRTLFPREWYELAVDVVVRQSASM
ncbi:hypothetical protein BDZ89DRAFT_115711 [Hymenopellis radicata]|nr:hypothetical protein BDZ89DRAFT_115711 [Hymenopellis radicata]